MSDKNRKIPRLQLQEPRHAREYIRRLLREVKAQGSEHELSQLGKIAQLLGIWGRLWELDKIVDIEKRLEALEAIKGNKR
jgi:hypothetical protein